jgi:cytochrome c
MSMINRHKMRATLVLFLLSFAQVPIANSAAIHVAAKKGDLAALEAALNAGADVNESAGGLTPLFYAATRGQVEAAKLLIARGADVDGMTLLGTPLMAAADRNGPELVELLLANGANPNADRKSHTALHVAAERGCLGCVKALVEAGANVNARHIVVSPPFTIVTTPLHLAKLNDHGDIAEYLIAHGVVFPKPAPIAARLASADPGKGKAVFEHGCYGCHVASVGQVSNPIINLWNVVGRDKASVENQGYSKAMLALPGAWTYEDLNVYLSGPTLTAPGVRMDIQGLRDENDRINVIAYLRTLSDNPVPLP